MVLSAINSCNDFDWFLDSGATSHMVKNKKLNSNVVSSSSTVMVADKKLMTVEGVGTGQLKTTNGEWIPVTI